MFGIADLSCCLVVFGWFWGLRVGTGFGGALSVCCSGVVWLFCRLRVVACICFGLLFVLCYRDCGLVCVFSCG